MHWSSIPIHIVDFEGSVSSGIVEYGIVTLYEGSIVEAQTRLCKATGVVSKQDVRQHGITNEMLEDKVPFSKEWELFANMRERGPLGAHHAHTENVLLKNTWPFPRMAQDFMNLNETCATWGPWIDTCQLFKVVYPQLKKYKLSHLIEVFQLGERLEKISLEYCPKFRRRYHCALYDALASAILLLYLMGLEEFKDITLQWLIMYSSSLGKRDELNQLSL